MKTEQEIREQERKKLYFLVKEVWYGILCIAFELLLIYSVQFDFMVKYQLLIGIGFLLFLIMMLDAKNDRRWVLE